MATPPRLVEPPVHDAPMAEYPSGQRFSHAWTAYHQALSDQVSAQATVLATKPGVTDASEATPGQIGEYLRADASGVSLANDTPTNIVTLALSAGDWDVSGNVQFVATGALTLVTAGVSTVSGNWNTYTTSISGTLGTAGSEHIGSGGAVRVIVSAATTAYLVAAARFTSGGVTAGGAIFARRMR